jgi:hypothetical protein
VGPNAGAFEQTETRTGPPLEYVAEKFRSALEGLHEWRRSDSSLSAQTAFRNGVVGFLALHNLLAYANDDALLARLGAVPPGEFRDWLDGIQDRGSITG